MGVQAFESPTSQLKVIVGFLLGVQDSSIVNFYGRILASGPDSQAVAGLGEQATFCRGQLLVRDGDIFLLVIVTGRDYAHGSKGLLDVERRLATLALASFR